jgi:hypothetical protein
MSEAEALALAKGEWSQAEARNRLKAGWQAWAQEKYRKIARDPNAVLQER